MNDIKTDFDAHFQEEEATALRKIIAKRMVESKLTNPHFYLTVDVDVDHLSKARSTYIETHGRKISYNDIFMKAVAHLMMMHPECNIAFCDNKIRHYSEVNICIAVAVDGGLLTPTVRNCEKKSIAEINEEAISLVEKARGKRLRQRESQGGTFTLSNLGMYGIEEFAAILNPPQSMILAVGAIRETPVVRDGRIAIGKRMKMTLSCDHKVLDGAVGALFLAGLKEVLENPARLNVLLQ